MAYNPFNKKDISKLTYDDLKSLIENEIGEGWYIEYKRDVPKLKTGKLDNIKISKSISSFANTNGGWVFWGIDSDNKNKPTVINGFDASEYRNFEDQISQIINSNINPTPYYHFKKIQLENDNIVLIIKVDESPIPPYITSQGVIFQRENNESKPLSDRYSLEKLNEKAKNYLDEIENFSTMNLTQSKGQSESNQTYLELYLFPMPFNSFKFKNFYSSDFFKKVADRFYKGVEVDFQSKNSIAISLGFNSIYHSDGSLIIRPLKEGNLIYKSTTVELFKNGNLKLLIPVSEFTTGNIPKKYENSNTIKYLLDTYSPLETVDPLSYSLLGMSVPPPNPNLSPLKERKRTDFTTFVNFIDGMDLITVILIIINHYKSVLNDNDFDFETKIGFRARITDCWRKFVFFDNDDYLKKLKLYNIPLSPKDEIEIPKFKKGNAYIIDLKNNLEFFQIAKIILRGIGLPDAHAIKFQEIIMNGFNNFQE
ncbi:AlbA family DNA-binding domain-containing protein [Kordia jejudonensis]|uniref:AlbA family DNA-binding domain-containing protein n=1 Tax=Kordia jejudonensis TaxID=1348245 RepID=UPI0006295751|nr:ATP-binding protein [Kordia jejudonensis]